MTPELVFLHIPKTAGTSQHRSFRQYYGRENVFWIGDDCSADVRKYPADQISGRLLVGGHKPLSFYPKRFDPLFCAVLRDPVERAISLFVYYTQPHLALSEGGRQVRESILERLQKKGMDPHSMINSIRNCRSFRREISNMQCTYISSSHSNFEGALKSLQGHDFILGTLNDYERFHRRLGDLLDWPEGKPGALNRSKGNYAGAYLRDEQLVALLREHNREDYKLLEFVTHEHDGLFVNLRNPAQRQQRLRSLPLDPWISKSAKLGWENIGRQLWPLRGGDNLPWPQDKILVSEAHRLLYMAIPGPVNAVVYRLMLDCSSIEHQDAARGLGLGRVLTRFETGLMLSDRSAAQAEAILGDSEYFKFACVREPVDRLVGVYVQKFVLNRRQLLGEPRLAALIAGVQGGGDTANVDEGISFREFVTTILHQEPQQQHWLWAPQYLYLQGLRGYDKLYRSDQLELLRDDLKKFRGLSVTIPKPALSPVAAPRLAGQDAVTPAKFADCRPPELSPEPSEWRDQLVDRALCEQILQYYAQDRDLYNSAADISHRGGLTCDV